MHCTHSCHHLRKWVIQYVAPAVNIALPRQYWMPACGGMTTCGAN
jgi:hypothetical protein